MSLAPRIPFAARLARSLGAALFLVALVALPGCKGTTPIKELLDDPSRFKDQTVRISGNVTSSIGALGAGVYQVDDGTGKIHVVAKSGGVPREGAKVGVEGKVEQGFTLGTQSLTVLVEEKRVSP